MSERDAQIILDDMREAVAKIERYLAELDREAFLADEKTVDAVVRNLEIIGEAARQLPDEFKTEHADIAWAEIGGLRNRIVHEYFGLDLDLIWRILQDDLPALKAQLERLSE